MTKNTAAVKQTKKPSCRKKEVNNYERENDFVVIGPTYIVNIEVKNSESLQASAGKPVLEKNPLSDGEMNQPKNQKCKDPIEIAKNQHKKVVKLICGIAEKTLGQCQQTINLIQLMAFPKLEHGNTSLDSVDSEVKSVLINKSDLQDFKSVWNKKVKSRKVSVENVPVILSSLDNKTSRIVPQVSIYGDIGKIQRVLFRLFAIGTSCVEDIEKKQGSEKFLPDCVDNIERKLKSKIILTDDCVADIEQKLKSKIILTDCVAIIELELNSKISLADCVGDIERKLKSKISLANCVNDIERILKSNISLTDCVDKFEQNVKSKISLADCLDDIKRILRIYNSPADCVDDNQRQLKNKIILADCLGDLERKVKRKIILDDCIGDVEREMKSKIRLADCVVDIELHLKNKICSEDCVDLIERYLGLKISHADRKYIVKKLKTKISLADCVVGIEQKLESITIFAECVGGIEQKVKSQISLTDCSDDIGRKLKNKTSLADCQDYVADCQDYFERKLKRKIILADCIIDLERKLKSNISLAGCVNYIEQKLKDKLNLTDCVDDFQKQLKNETSLADCVHKLEQEMEDKIRKAFSSRNFDIDRKLKNQLILADCIDKIEEKLKSKCSLADCVDVIERKLESKISLPDRLKIEKRLKREISVADCLVGIDRKLKSQISLADCVVDIDRKLRDGRITFERENRSSNPNVLKTSDTPDTPDRELDKFILKDCLGLKYITTEQWEAYQKESDGLIITGGPGSGKTLVLLARIIRLALTSKDSKIKLSVGNHIDLVKYKSVFEKAGIESVEEQYANMFDLESKLIIAHRPPSVSKYKFDYEFIDDYQVQPCKKQNKYAEQKPCVLTVDLNQKPQTTTAEKVFQYCGSLYDIVQLSASYRNTRNIVTQLIKLRELIGRVQTENQTEEKERLAHTPAYGHFIHGPQILVQVYRQDAIEYFHWDTIEKIFNLEIKDREIECAFFFFPHFFHRIGIKNWWIEKYFKGLFSTSATGKELFISSEFIQCHILLPFDPKDYTASLQFLYNAISRARVLCHVHVLVNKTYIRDEVDEKLRVIFPEARIIYE